jgi:hypothetical protein
MQSQVHPTTLLDQVVHYKNELIVPVQCDHTRPDGSVRTSYTWFTLDVLLVICESREEFSSVDGAIAIAKMQIDLDEARLNFAY